VCGRTENHRNATSEEREARTYLLIGFLCVHEFFAEEDDPGHCADHIQVHSEGEEEVPQHNHLAERFREAVEAEQVGKRPQVLHIAEIVFQQVCVQFRIHDAKHLNCQLSQMW
jgi:hypothetical protein